LSRKDVKLVKGFSPGRSEQKWSKYDLRMPNDLL